MAHITKPLTVYIPDTRGVVLSRYGSGNLKLGFGVYTYSRLPGHVSKSPLGMGPNVAAERGDLRGTCPGATEECQAICYANRPVVEDGIVGQLWATNSRRDDVPPIPEDCSIIRLHVSGDFDTVAYIQNWITRFRERPDVKAWVYTRSWRVPELLPHLEELRALGNVQVFASMDASCVDLPPVGWRRSWILRETPVERAGRTLPVEARLAPINLRRVDATFAHSGTELATGDIVHKAFDGTVSLICPEETKRKANCLDCGYCFQKGNDVTFLEH